MVNSVDPIRTCTKCGKELAVNEENFRRKKNGKYGFCSQCKECDKTYREESRDIIQAYREKNKEKIDIQHKQWLARNKEHTKKYLESKKEHIAQYRIDNIEHIRERTNRYWKNNIDRLRAKNKQYRLDNAEYIKQRNQSREVKDKKLIAEQKRRARKMFLPASLTVEQWESIKIHFGNKCCYCGSDGKLEQDHFIPLSKGGEYTANNIVPSCPSCNYSKNKNYFHEWYPTSGKYNKAREKQILKYLDYNMGKQQLKFVDMW